MDRHKSWTTAYIISMHFIESQGNIQGHLINSLGKWFTSYGKLKLGGQKGKNGGEVLQSQNSTFQY
jgi:hypothetical protein